MSEKEHAYRKLMRALQEAEGLPPVLLLTGPEDYLIRWATDLLIRAYVEPAVQDFDLISLGEDRVDVQQLVAACETLPLLSRRRLVLVDDPALFRSGSAGRYSDADQKAWAACVASLPPTTLLVYRSREVDRRGKAFKLIKKEGAVFDFTFIDRREAAGFIRKRLSEQGKSISGQAVAELIDRTGYGEKDSDATLLELFNEIAKAAAYSLGEQVGLSDVEAVVPPALAVDVFHMMEAAFRGDRGRALSLLRQRMDQLPAYEKSGETLRLIALFCSQLELMLVALEHQSEGVARRDLATVMGVHRYRLEKSLPVAASKGLPYLRQQLGKAYGLESALKTGRLSEELALELFIAGL